MYLFVLSIIWLQKAEILLNFFLIQICFKVRQARRLRGLLHLLVVAGAERRRRLQRPQATRARQSLGACQL